MFKVTMRFQDGSKSKHKIESIEDLISYLNDADGYCWTFDITDGDDTIEAESDEADGNIRALTPGARAALVEIIDKIRENSNSLIINDDAIGSGPIFHITGKRDTSWDYQWNPEDPHYDHENPGNYKN